MNEQHIRTKVALVFESIIDGVITKHAPEPPAKDSKDEGVFREYNACLEQMNKDKFVLENLGLLAAQFLVDVHRIADAAEERLIAKQP